MLLNFLPRSLWLCFLFCTALIPFCQAQNGPGLVASRQKWLTGNQPNAILANQWLIDLNDSSSVLEQSLNTFQNQEYTCFIAIHPDSIPVNPATFAQLGTLVLQSDGAWLEGRFIPLDFKDGLTKILAVRGRNLKSAFKGHQAYQLHNPKLFSLAEVLVYDRALDSIEIRRVTSYLAIKHAVPLAKGNQSFAYFLKADQGKYWNEAISRLYNQDIIALGNSQEELLYQSQSATQDDSIKIGLDTLVSDGQFPNVGIADQSFIVFSKAQKQYRKYIKCQNSPQGNWNPLAYWKFELQNWHSRAYNLVLKLKGPFTKSDTLEIHSGSLKFTIHSQVDSSGNRIYQIPLADLPNNRHYFFKPLESSKCPSRLIISNLDSLGTIGLEIGDPSDSIFNIQFLNLKTGLSTSISAQNMAQVGLQLPDGDYLLRAYDAKGEPIYSEPIGIPLASHPESQNNLNLPLIEVYPKPCFINGKLQVKAQYLPAGNYKIILTDLNGRRHFESETSDHFGELHLEVPSPNVPGVYQLSIQHHLHSYSYLIPVKP